MSTSIKSMLTPQARRERAVRIVVEGLLELVKATIDDSGGNADTVDQYHLPLGGRNPKRRFLELARKGAFPSVRNGQVVTAKRADVDAYMLRNGIKRGEGSEEQDVVDIVDELTKEAAEPRRRRRRSNTAA